jgi:hypothetical protein
MYTQEHCIPNSFEKGIYDNKLLVIRANVLPLSMQNKKHQLWFCNVGGFGTKPDSRGRTVFAQNLYDKQQSKWYRQDFIGVLKPECITNEIRIELAKISPIRYEHLTQDAEQFDGYGYLGNGKYTPRVPLFGMDEVKKYIGYQKVYQHRLVICDKDDCCVFESVDGDIVFPAQEDIENHQGMEMRL